MNKCMYKSSYCRASIFVYRSFRYKGRFTDTCGKNIPLLDEMACKELKRIFVYHSKSFDFSLWVSNKVINFINRYN